MSTVHFSIGTIEAFRNWRSTIATTSLAFLLGFAGVAHGAGPDLTDGTTRFTIDRSFTFCLGPTGLRGWIYKDEGSIYLDRLTSVAPWQILVTSVGTGTPAYSIIQTNDVIIGARAGGGTVAAFTNDSRVELGNAITGAEATNGILRLLINRYLVGSNQTFTLQMKMTNMSYSATAPYNCPKSALILSNALKVVSARTISRSEALALLASGDPTYLPQVITYARMLCPGGYVAPWPDYGGAESIWDMGYSTMFLAEYYMVTNDPQVVNGLVQRATMLAKSDSMYGCYSHSGANTYPYHKAAGVHGVGAGYGPVNACGLVANVGVALGKRTGLQGIVTNAEVQPAITRAYNFYNYLVYKGGVNYGEMEPNNELVQWGSGGKNGIASLLFAAMGGQPTQAQYFSRLAMAGWADVEYGHGGVGWARHWQPLGANMGGTNAMAAFMASRRWYNELARRCDGSFAYECVSDVPETCDNYWDYESYYGYLDPTSWNALHLACAKQKLLITGKNADPTNTLNAVAISNDLWAAAYATLMGGYTTNQLFGHLGEFHPSVRKLAAQELAVRPASNTLVGTLATLATNASPWTREGACQALGYINITNAVTTLAGRMYDTDSYVRFRANEALNSFGSRASSQLTNMMNAFALFAVPDPLTSGINWTDPVGWGNGFLADVLFNDLASSVTAQPTNTLYPALRAAMVQPDGLCSGNMCSFLDNNSYWPWTRVKDLAPELMATALMVHQADNMWGGCQKNAINLLARNRVEDAIPLSVMSPFFSVGRHSGMDDCINNLKNYYRSAASNTVPSLLIWSNYYAAAGNTGYVAMVASTIATIVNDATPRTVTNFKTFASTVASPGSLSLPASNCALSTFVTDLDGNAPKYTWSKLSGPGTVSFSQNASTASSNTTATFTTPGTYVLRASASDGVINFSNYWVLTTPNWFEAYKMWTNEYGSVATTVTVNVYGLPFVNITNANYFETDFPQMLIGGTNNTQVVGGMRVVSMTGSTTNYTRAIPATLAWAAIVSNIVANMTNIVIVSGTNALGAATNDTIQIFRTPLPFLQITNMPVGMIVLPATSNTWRIAGTNNAFVVGWMWWTNTGLPNAGGRLGPAGGNWSTNVPLRTGFNYITVSGTNFLGTMAQDSYTVCVGTPPNMRITNLVSGSMISVPSAQSSQYVAGTNNMIVGGMIWSNSMGGGARIAAANPWNINASLSNQAYNVIRIWGTNTVGTIFADTVTVYRGETPYVNITNDSFTIPFLPVAYADIVVTNRAAVGYMWLASVAGTATNYTETIAATSPWTVTISNLLAGATNYVTVTATNVVGMMTNDTIEIYRELQPPGSMTTNMALTGNGTGGGLTTELDYNDGYRFLTGTNSLTVNWLGIYDAPSNDVDGTVGDGLWGSHWVYLWRESDQALLAQTLLVSGTVETLIGDFRGHAVTNVVLQSNTAYRITAVYDNVDRYRDGNDLAGWQTNEIYITGGCFGSSNAYPGGGWSIIIGPNFGYETQLPPAQILSFGPGAIINDAAKAINWTVPYGTDLMNLAPTYTVSSGTGVPTSGSTNDFTSPVVYTVTDGDLFVTNAYTVTVTIAPPPYVDITNAVPPVLSWDVTTFVVVGTNNAHVANAMWWSNTTAGVGGEFASAGGAWSIVVPLVHGPTAVVNRIAVYGTNQWSQKTNDTIAITVGGIGTGSPFGDITNAPVLLSYGISTYALGGTNNIHVMGGMWVSNAANGAVAQFAAAASWTTPSMPLEVGTNRLWVFSTNMWGWLTNDSVVVTRASVAASNVVTMLQSVAGTQVNAYVAFRTHSWSNGAAQIGCGTSTDGSGWTWCDAVVTNAQSPFVAVTNMLFPTPGTYYYGARWIVDGRTNYGWNANGQTNATAMAAEYAIVITALAPFVNITNEDATVAGTVTNYWLSGTNSVYTAGMIAWTNSLGGNGSVPASATGWSFSVSLTVGTNTITAYGTNAFGVVSSDSVVITRLAPATLVSGVWTSAAGGSWTNTACWQGGAIANGADMLADISTLNITVYPTITLDKNRTIGHVKAADTVPNRDWTLDAGTPAGVLTLTVSAGMPTMTVVNRLLAINAVIAGDDGMCKAGTGTLELYGDNTYTGPTVVSNGTLLVSSAGALASSEMLHVVAGGTCDVSGVTVSLATNQTVKGSGIVMGNLVANGVVEPGDALGTLTVNGSMTLGSTAATKISLNRGSSPSADKLSVNGTLTCAGTLEVTNVGSALQDGDSFDMIDAAIIAGGFSTCTFPALPAGKVWNTNTLPTSGMIVVASAIGYGTPFLDVTNTAMTVVYAVSNITVAGTNNAQVVGSLAWTNELNGAAGAIQVTGDKFQVTGIPLAVGTNTITVRGTNALGTASSDSVTVERLIPPPEAPMGVVASDGTYTNKVVVNWVAASTATAYAVYRNTVELPEAAEDISGAIVGTTFDDTNVVPNRVYVYWVKARNVGGWSIFGAGDQGHAGVNVAVPALSPGTLDFSTNAVCLFATLGNSGTMPYSYSAVVAPAGAWLTVNPLNGAVSNTSAAMAVEVSRSGLADGRYTGSVTVTAAGTTMVVVVSMDVAGNLIAEANGPYLAEQGSPVVFTAAGSKGAAMSFAWKVGTNGWSDYSTNHATYAFTNTLEPGEFDVRLSVRDTNAPPSELNDSTRLTIVNVPPTLDIGGPYQGSNTVPVQFTAVATDRGTQDLLEYRWDFEGNGTWDTGWQASTTTSHLYLAGGSYLVQCEVRDNRGGSAADTATALIQQSNMPPVAAAVVYGTVVTVTNLPGLGYTVTLSGAGSYDPDNKPLTNLYFDWREDQENPQKPVTVESNRHNSIMTTMPLTEPGEYRFHMVVYDGEYNSKPATVVVRVPGWRGEVICEGFLGRVPLWGVEAIVTNTYNQQLKTGRTDLDGQFLADSGSGYQIGLLHRRGLYKSVSVNIDADGGYTKGIYYLPYYYIYAGQVVTGTPGNYVGLVGVQVEVTIGNGMTTMTDLNGQFGFGSVPESWPLDGSSYKVRVQKVNFKSKVMDLMLTMSRNSETILLEPMAGNAVVSGTVRTEGRDIAKGVTVQFGDTNTTVTTTNGAFGPIVLPEGTYTVELKKQSYAKTIVSPVVLKSGATNLSLMILGGLGTVGGEILNGNGTPVTNAVVRNGGKQPNSLPGMRKASGGTGFADASEVPATMAGYYYFGVAKGQPTTYEVISRGYEKQSYTDDIEHYKKRDIIMVPEQPPSVAITNTPEPLGNSATECVLFGTNNMHAEGPLWWSNLTAQACGPIRREGLGWSGVVSVVHADTAMVNVIRVYATNWWDEEAQDEVEVTVCEPGTGIPFVDVTNETEVVASNVASYVAAGTNNAQVVGGMWVTNTTVGGMALTFAASPSWSTPAIGLAYGENCIAVVGTNTRGIQAFDTVYVTRSAIDYMLPFVDVTTTTATVPNDVSGVAVAGTNNSHVVGMMWATNETAGGAALEFAAGASWTSPLVPLVVGANVVVVNGTNVFGVGASDAVVITRGPAGTGTPFLDVTTTPATVSYDIASIDVAGTNNAQVVGSLAWTNHLTGTSGSFTIYDVRFTILDVALGVGANMIVVSGTNASGVVASDNVVVTRGPVGTGMPFIDVTTTPAVVSYDAASWTVAGTNNVHVVGELTWTNTLNAAGGGMAVTGDTFQVTGVPLGIGTNIISVSGSNTFGVATNDSVVVIRGGIDTSAPFVDVTNAPVTVPNDTLMYAVAGTNNARVVGTMWATNDTAGGAARQFAASASWTAPAVPLALGANLILVRGTNVCGEEAGDWVVITRAPAGSGSLFVDVTNVPCMVPNDVAAFAVAGTNNAQVVGGMRVTNDTAGGASLDFGAGASWVAPPISLAVGANTIRVIATNMYGATSNDTVVVTRGPAGTGLPFVDTTNTTATVGNHVSIYAASGTNNLQVVGGMWVTNETAGGAGHLFDANPSWTAPSVGIATGINVIVVKGTNAYGAVGTDSIVITREGYGVHGVWTRVSSRKERWIDASCWSNQIVAAGKNALADFSTIDTKKSQVVILDGTRTIGHMKSADKRPHRNWLFVGGTLRLSVGIGLPTINVVNQKLTIGAVVDGSDGLCKEGAGMLVLSSTNSFTGPTVVSNGVLKVAKANALARSWLIDVCSRTTQDVSSARGFAIGTAQLLQGGGSVVGNLVINGTNSPGGAGIGSLTFTRNLVMGTSAVTLLQTDRSVTPNADLVNVKRKFTAGGTLVVSNRGPELLVGDSFNLIDGKIVGTFSSVVLPPLGAGRAWNTSSLYLSGVVTVVQQPAATDVEQFEVGKGAEYGQVSLAWSNGPITVLWCTNRSYSSSPSSWSVLTNNVQSPWTHTAASNYAAVYYRIVSGTYTSQYDVGKFDVQVLSGSIAWLSFPFTPQAGCDVLSEWFGGQVEARPYVGFDFPSLQRQNRPGGTIILSDYYAEGGVTNWNPNSALVANAGYVLLLPKDHGPTKVTGIGVVQTNNVTMQIPYSSIPWIGLSYPLSLDMRISGLASLFVPPSLYSGFNYDFAESQQTLGGAVQYVEYFVDDWGTDVTNFFPSASGADTLEPGKAYLLFFSTKRAGTGTWTCTKPY